MKCEACDHENIDGARFCAGCGALLPSEHTGEDPMVGQLIGGRYRVTGVLGEGGMGVVYVGEQQMGSAVRKVAIKTLHQHLSKDSSVLARFHRECGTVAGLEHPNTIKFYDFGATEDGTLYIAMEFVEGQPLNEVIEKDGALDPTRVVHIMRQVAGALDEAHEQSIIHRDLKPENIVLGRRAGQDDFVKVLDFGIAARTESADKQKEQKLTQQGMVLGTPPYMSPEQFTGKELDRRSDVYSLGVMAYEMLTGQLPFDADTPWQWATEHMTAQPRPFEAVTTGGNIPAAMREAIMKALAKDPAERQATAREFFEELSEGGRMTVDAAAAESSAGATAPGGGTAAMAAVPDFGAGASTPGPIPAAPGMGAAPMAGAPPVAAIPAAPSTNRGSGGGKGLIIGLAAVGGLLLIAMVVVAAGSLKPEDDVPPAELTVTSSATTGASGDGTVKPLVPTADPEPDAAPTGEVVAADGAPTSKTSAGSKASGASGSTPSKTSGSTPDKTSGSTPDKTSGSTPDKSSGGGGSDACARCIQAAGSGNIQGAAAAMRQCSDPKGKQDCRTAARAPATRAVETAAKSGNCGAAQAMAQAAGSLGINSARISKAVKSCK